MDQLLLTNTLLLVATKVKAKDKKAAIDIYKAMLLNDIFKLPNIGRFKLSRFLISN